MHIALEIHFILYISFIPHIVLTPKPNERDENNMDAVKKLNAIFEFGQDKSGIRV